MATVELADPPGTDRPTGPDLFTQEGLDAHARALGLSHALSSDPRHARPLLPRLDESARRLEEAYQFLSAAARAGSSTVGSEDWLLDNYHVAQDQIREVRQDLPRRYYLELPKLSSGAFAGYPRVYLLARELIFHTAARLDLDILVDFSAAYQEASPLSIGEIWAIPIMLRLGLVEELDRLGRSVVAARRGRLQALAWETAVGTGRLESDAHLDARLRAEAGPDGRLPAAYVVELLLWLRDQPGSAAPTWHALQRALEAQGDTPDELLRVEQQREAADQVAMGNVITSMRLLSSLEWPLFFDRISVVEAVLREDPAGAYGAMDFLTRDRYRHSIEQLARRSRQPEPAIARRAVELAAEARTADPDNDRRHHVGYYLISRGRFRLERDVGYESTVRDTLSRFIFAHPALGYLGTLGLVLGAGVASLLAYAERRGGSFADLWLVAIVVLVPVSELALSLLNSMLTSLIPPRQLPKLAMRDGIPAGDRTMVVVPAMIAAPQDIVSLFHDLEVRFFANQDAHLHFAILSDFADAPAQVMPEDASLLEAARRQVDDLNERHGSPDRFFVFHRERRWNPAEGRWMGWERKRGKIEEFTRRLRGFDDTSFVVQHGHLEILTSIRYVITLDADTQLPRDAGRSLVGTLSHPLNRPRVDPAVQRVTQGYGILQPGVDVSVESAGHTSFAQIFAGHVGVDPYTTAVSDLYQDVFHEGSYVGKGIFDVDAFRQTLEGRVPDNSLLSHDLFEGFYARTGLCTDVRLVDGYPSTYLAFATRQHRWVRGDWQIIRWLWPTVPDAHGRPVPNTLPAISRWKILDNLRRSLLSPALLLLLVTGWTTLPGSPVLWSTLALLVLAFPAYMQVGRSLSGRVRGVPLGEQLRAERDNLRTSARQALLSTVFLAHQSWMMLDAIVRTLWRLLITRRRLLEWVTTDHRRHAAVSEIDVARHMWMAPAIAGGIGVLVAVVAPGRLWLALPAIALWVASPVIAYVTGRPLQHYRPALSRRERTSLRMAARRTWRYFEDLVGPVDRWLVPDNYQIDRRDVIAHRTSPTNIGLQVLSAVAARDLGYTTTTAVIERLEPTFATLLAMPRYRGHFYNWYDTQTLAALSPAYVSTVDSGNLVGYLIALRTGLTDLTERTPIVDRACLDGLGDVLDLCEEEIAAAGRDGGAVGRSMRKEVAAARALLDAQPATIGDWTALLEQIQDQLSGAGVLFQELEESRHSRTRLDEADHAMNEAGHWLERAAATLADLREELRRLTAGLPSTGPVPTPAEVADLCARALQTIPPGEDKPRRAALEQARQAAEDLVERADRLNLLADDFIEETEFGFLFNPDRQLFSIGFSAAEGRLDRSHYDSLASEARLASFVAIATGQIPQEHWFRLGRSLTPSGASRALLSWSASMFEYLMPLLVMRAYPGTLLAETYDAVVQRQIQYGAQRGVPWGISESAYFAQDLEGNYQYRAFGVPGLGLKRGLADELVVAPYASILAASLAPAALVDNLEQLRAQGMYGRYGYYEAIDYTVERLPADHTGGRPLPTYMAHHQGMSLLALDNLLMGAPMQARFHADPRVQATELLLQERIPHLVPLKNPPIEKAEHVPTLRRSSAPTARRFVTPHTLSPRTHLLSNGSYSVMVTNAGGGYSRRQGLALTRWREDITTDRWGSFCYLRDLENGDVWSTTFQPTRREPDEYEVTFAPDRAMWRRRDLDIEVRTEVVVSPEDDVELRRVSITNHSRRARQIEITSYGEVVLAPWDADLSHPVFSNLFVETSAVPEGNALICVRRPRSGDARLHMIHVVSGGGRLGGQVEYETDRARFIGRGRTLERPAALYGSRTLSNTTGPVLDPIVSLRRSLRIPPGGTARVSFATGFADNADAARRLIDKYHDRRAVARALALASTHSQIELRHLGLAVDETMLFQRLGGRLIYADQRLRVPEAVEENVRGQNELWKYGISGDLPILLARLTDASEVPLVRELLKAHEYLRMKGFVFDLIILNDLGTSYLQDLQHSLMQMVETGPEQAWIDRPGGVFVRRSDLMPVEDQTLLRAVARAVMHGADGSLVDQLTRPRVPSKDGPKRRPDARRDDSPSMRRVIADGPSLERFNGIGGFDHDGREYVVHVNQNADVIPPTPWSNVVAHPTFGFAATECGPGYTWSGNSHDNRLTPWNNDPVADPPGEAVYIRDEASGQIWSATPLPQGGGQPYIARHGQGYTSFEHVRHDLASELLLFVPGDDQVKVFRLTLRNRSAARRRYAVTIYVEWVLGENRTRAQSHIVTSREPVTGALIARNAFRLDFASRIALLDLHPGRSRTVTGDRAEFIGRNGSLECPAALERESLSDRTGAGLDPCGAVQVVIDVEAGGEQTLIGLLGEAGSVAEVEALVTRYRDERTVADALAKVRGFWDHVTGAIAVRTPDRALDLLVNRWLPYQTLACRIWGRSAFYQSSGAFGFRDQLQDVLALILARPGAVREQLLRAASRQFTEGDVQHWWHEPGGQGVRTRFSDDRLWLVDTALQYVAVTGDSAVFDEHVPFLEGRLLEPDEHESYDKPTVSADGASLYEHCVRAISVSLGTGAHGLPLIGTGDWNDGMNMVGPEGKGESVWLAWFLLSILRPFADLADVRGEHDRAAAYRRHGVGVLKAIEESWDGDWYRRAYFDDGTPLGSATSEECRIDAIAQAWAVIAGGGDTERARRAMESADQYLVRRDDRLVLLLTPPFDRMTPSPGYIQGYLPGVRENGGQYTHAALWTVLAFARLGDGDRAGELFGLINPINHSGTREGVARYRAEPYVVAADVYSRPPHVGRGGWTWYTGSAGWMYRVAVEGILGLTVRDGGLIVDPCIPRAWPGFEATLRLGTCEYRIVVENPEGVCRGVRRVEVDGVEVAGHRVTLSRSAASCSVRVVLGAESR